MNAGRSDAARRLLSDPLFQELMDDLEAQALSAIVSSDMANREFREDCYRMVKTLHALRGQLEAYAAEASHERAKADAIRMMGGQSTN